jgi:aminopeptidase N
VAEEVSGRSLEAFFDVYLYQSTLPRLETDRTNGTLRLRWANTGDVAFEVPVPVRIDGRTTQVTMTGGAGSVKVPAGASVEVDPKGWILRAQ